MAILQISQIQIRRGLQQDLPQLASAEMGWGLDTRRLFIGNGTLSEGAPTEGMTEIMTQYSNVLQFNNLYTFAGTDSGYTSVTGVNALSPVTRSIQSALDDNVTVKDFGAVGDGVTDDTAAINRAIQQIYISTLNTTHANVQRTIKIPAGTYLTTSPLLIPPNCTLKGDGKNNSIINNTGSSYTFQSCDSLFQSGGAQGTNGAVNPQFITVQDIQLKGTTSAPVVYLNNTTDAIFDRVTISGGSYSASLNGTSSVIKFFNGTFTGYVVASLTVASTVTGLVTRNDRFDTYQKTLSAGTSTITTLTGAGYIDYQLFDSSNNYRFGRVNYNVSNGVATFDESFNEPAVALGANVYIWSANANVTCSVTNTTTIKYQVKQFSY